MLDEALWDGLIAANPVTKVRRPKVPHTDAPVVDVDDLRLLLKTAPSSAAPCTLKSVRSA